MTSRNSHGFDFWYRIFAGEWEHTTHQFESRDVVYTVLILSAVATLVLAVYEMHFSRRRAGLNRFGLIEFVGGLVIAIGGVVALHMTDGIAAGTSPAP